MINEHFERILLKKKFLNIKLKEAMKIYQIGISQFKVYMKIEKYECIQYCLRVKNERAHKK
jgi:hypothetical protein